MQTCDVGIRGMDCMDCARTLESGVARLGGVSSAAINFGAARLTVTYDPQQTGPDAIAARVRALGYDIAEAQPAAELSPPAESLPSRLPAPLQAALDFTRFLAADPQLRPVLAGAALLAASMLAGLAAATAPAAAPLAVLALLIAGAPQARDAVRALVLSRRVTIGLLMSIAAVGAVVIGEPAEGAAVVVLFAIGEAIESFTMARARSSLDSLMRLAPAEANVLSPCVDCEEHMGRDGYAGGPCPWCGTHVERRPAAEVAPGATILVRPGERVPLDGVVSRGSTAVSQQHLTGESAPVERAAGDEVFAGSINGDGAIEVAVTRAAGDSLLSRIAQLVQEAQGQRAPIERFVDRFAAIYTPAVVAAALLMVTVPTLAFGQPLWDGPGGQHGWLYRALALLVVACPCALVISTPVTIVSALSAATRAGVLIRGGAALEALRRIKVVAFDKTGTLTRGHPEVTGVRCAGQHAAGEPCGACDELLALAAAVEARSAHPLAGAVVRAARERDVAARYAAEDVTALPGRGLRGVVGGAQVAVGSHAFFDAEHQHGPEICSAVAEEERRGQTVMMVCSCEGGGVRGYISLADQLRSETPAVVARLREAGVARTAMLTGDNRGVGEAVARAAGVDEARCGLLPAEKLEAVRELSARYGPIAMVGDGANDTPALAGALVGVAMGAAGSDQALATADVALINDDLATLPFLLRLSRRVAAVVRQNIALSLLAKLAFLALALGGVTSLWLAVLADSGVALLVTLNGMRLLRERPDR